MDGIPKVMEIIKFIKNLRMGGHWQPEEEWTLTA
jgi:hypothetical protein